MAKKKRAQQRCGKCQQTGHNAKGCTQAAAPEVPRLNKLGKPSGRIAGASNGDENRSDFVSPARDSAKAAARRLLSGALAEAKAYVAELERLASA